MRIDVELIAERLFADDEARSRIVQDYGIGGTPGHGEHLTGMVLDSIAWPMRADPLAATLDNGAVFRAAVWALGSNARPWGSFLAQEAALAETLHGYDPLATHRAALGGRLGEAELRVLLPGQSSAADARAVLRWARLLSEVPDYYAYLVEVAGVFQEMSRERLGRGLTGPELLLCVVGQIGGPPARWAGAARLSRRIDPRHEKTPGMGYILASEMLRNLGWDGFKPDRHVQRLIDLWWPGGAQRCLPEAGKLMELIGRNDVPLRTFLTYALAGMALAPEGVPLARVDHMVWMLGAYLERRGRESGVRYVHNGRP